jgi:osmotically-inducible protein OsmY
MTEPEQLCSAVRAAIEHQLHVDSRDQHLDINVRNGALLLEGEVQDIILKRMLAPVVEKVPGVQDVVDRIQVTPSERREDGALFDAVYEAISEEPVFRNHDIAALNGVDLKTRSKDAAAADGYISLKSHDGVVTLRGKVPSLSHKRLAEVLAWWTTGVVGVSNQLCVTPDEEDNDDEITDALRMVLEKDPWLDAGQIWAHTHEGTVVLDGLLPSKEQKHMAECDAWYVNGVTKVTNRIEVRP